MLYVKPEITRCLYFQLHALIEEFFCQLWEWFSGLALYFSFFKRIISDSMPNADSHTTKAFQLFTCFILIGYVKNSNILVIFIRNYDRIIFKLEFSTKSLLLNQKIS